MKGLGYNPSSVSGLSAGVSKQPIVWKDYSEDLHQKALAEGKGVFIDFESKIWCAACREMEEITYPHPDVVNSLEPFVMMKVDVDKHPHSESLQKKFKVVGIPTVILINPLGVEVDRIIGFVAPKPFIEKIQSLGL